MAQCIQCHTQYSCSCQLLEKKFCNEVCKAAYEKQQSQNTTIKENATIPNQNLPELQPT